jgi:hypothetical protein
MTLEYIHLLAGQPGSKAAQRGTIDILSSKSQRRLKGLDRSQDIAIEVAPPSRVLPFSLIGLIHAAKVVERCVRLKHNDHRHTAFFSPDDVSVVDQQRHDG